MNHAPAVQAAAEVVLNRRLTPEVFLLRLHLDSGWGPALPGQFVQLECPPEEAFGLRRPFSLSACRPGPGSTELEIVYGVVGTRTRGLSQVQPGARLHLAGPLGRPFREVPGRRPVLVGGGRGLAPMLMLAEARRAAYPDGLILYGVRTASLAIPTAEAAYPVCVSCDDGSMGLAGTVIDLLDSLVASGELDPASMALFSCGPNIMLAALDRWSMERSVPCQLSLETHFGCGLGICAGCAVPVRALDGETRDAFGRYILACQEGPVVDAGIVEWEGVHE